MAPMRLSLETMDSEIARERVDLDVWLTEA
jgi:hypothetical protein